VRYALQSIRRKPARTLATAIGIGLATALVVILLAVSAGIQQSSNQLAASSGIDLLATSANTSLENGAFPPVTHSHDVPAQMHSADTNVATASPWLLATLVFANASLYAASNASQAPAGWIPTGAGAVGWIPDANVGLDVPQVTNGGGFTASGDPHYAGGTYQGPATHEVVLDVGLAELLRVGPGDLVWASPQAPAGPPELPGWYANATAFRVVGVSGPFWLIPSALLGFFYLSELQSLVGGASASTDFSSIVLVHLTDQSNPAIDQALLGRAFPQLTVFTLANVVRAVESTVNLYRTFGTLIGVIAIVVATLFTSTVLLMSVDDRSREIALLRAIGYSPTTIGTYVVEEGLLLSVVGLAIGLLAGFAGAYLLNVFLERSLQDLPSGFQFVAFNLSVIGNGILEVLVIGLVASILPALRAVRLDPAVELRAP